LEYCSYILTVSHFNTRHLKIKLGLAPVVSKDSLPLAVFCGAVPLILKFSLLPKFFDCLMSSFQQKAQSVKDALEILVGRDQLEGVTCSRTNQEVEAWQQVTLEELPLVLLLHLKLFDYKLDGASKIVKCVEFPIDLKVDPSKYSSL
jgi:hypothetical protein